MIFNMTGGGASLNFDVKAYATEAEMRAATPAENSIGVVTTTEITSYIFASEEPAEPVEGMVWFCTGVGSSAEFNALKKENAIQIYPLAARQYINNTFVEVPVMSYQAGEWVHWYVTTYLYDNGFQNETITGGWSHVNDSEYADYTTTPSLGYSYRAGSGNFSHFWTNNLIDLTKFRVLRGECVKTANANDYQRFGVTRDKGAGAWDTVFVACVDISTGTLSVDISGLTGSYRVEFGCKYYGGAYFTRIWLE